MLMLISAKIILNETAMRARKNIMHLLANYINMHVLNSLTVCVLMLLTFNLFMK